MAAIVVSITTIAAVEAASLGLLPTYYSGLIVITKVLHVPSMKLNGHKWGTVIPQVIPRQITQK